MYINFIHTNKQAASQGSYGNYYTKLDYSAMHFIGRSPMKYTATQDGYIKLGSSEYNKVYINNILVGYGDNSYIYPVSKNDIIEIVNADYIDYNNFFIPFKQ